MKKQRIVAVLVLSGALSLMALAGCSGGSAAVAPKGDAAAAVVQADGAPQDALAAGEGELYQNLHGYSWVQTGDEEDVQLKDVLGTQREGQETYDGTDVSQIHQAYCFGACHSESALGSYKADAATARADVERMMKSYGCDMLTQEQADALVASYSE